jgi:hypothetical protein
MNTIDAALHAEITAAVSGARYFSATIWHDQAYHAYPLRTLTYARAVAKLLPAFHRSERRAMVFAVIEEQGVEHGVLVPDDWASPHEIIRAASEGLDKDGAR